MTHREIAIPYGDALKTVTLRESSLAWVTGPRDIPPIQDVPEMLRTAIRTPISSPTLPELVAAHGRRTLILVDDSTRSTPQSLMLPVLLDELNAAGVADKHIAIVIARGTHRPMTSAECVARFGRQAMERVPVVNLSSDPADFVHLGTTGRGVPIEVSRQYLESDLSIAVGNIVPHMYAGWAGGAKMVQPGVSSPLTTAKTHLMAGPCVLETLGRVENPVRHEMEEIAIKSGLKFIVNVVLSRSGGIAAVVAGDVVQAHRAGVHLAEPIYTVEVNNRADIVVAGSHPADRDLWQGFKPLTNCGMLVKDGGTLILVIPAPEGISRDHPELVQLGQTPADAVLEMLKRGAIANEVAAATYLALDQTRRRIHITLVGDGIQAAEARQIGLAATPSLEQALELALARHGKDASVGVVTHGADFIGRVRAP